MVFAATQNCAASPDSLFVHMSNLEDVSGGGKYVELKLEWNLFCKPFVDGKFAESWEEISAADDSFTFEAICATDEKFAAIEYAETTNARSAVFSGLEKSGEYYFTVRHIGRDNPFKSDTATFGTQDSSAKKKRADMMLKITIAVLCIILGITPIVVTLVRNRSNKPK